jgi:hypothetical protein
VTLANRAPEPFGHDGPLPAGIIKVDFVMTTQAAISVETPPASAIPITFGTSVVIYSAYWDGAWIIQGNHSAEGRRYVITAISTTPELPPAALEVVLGTWEPRND